MSLVCVCQNYISSVSADKEGLPAAHVLSNYLRQEWRSTDGTGTIVATSGGLSKCVVVHTANAETITIRAEDGLGGVVSPPVEYDMLGVSSLSEFMVGATERKRRTFVYREFDHILPAGHVIIIDFYKSYSDLQPVSSGLVWSGVPLVTKRNVNKGLKIAYEDYSYVEDDAFNNGSAYIIKRDTATTISAELVGTQQEISDLCNKLQYVAPGPIPFVIIDDADEDLIGFYRFSSPQSRSLRSSEYSLVTFSLKESI